MCLALPGKVLSVDGEWGQVDFGGVVRKVNVFLASAEPGDWVMVHAGFAIEKMDEEEAMETLQLWKEVMEHEETSYTV